MAREYGTEKVYTITQNNTSQDVIIRWGNTSYFDDSYLLIPANYFDFMRDLKLKACT